MRAIVLQLFHEANAFLPERVTLADFRRRHYAAGDEVRQRFGASNNWMGGVLAAHPPRGAAEILIRRARERAQGHGDNCSLVLLKLSA